MGSEDADGYRIGKLNGDFVITWREDDKRRRFRLGPANLSKDQLNAAYTRFVQDRQKLLDEGLETVAQFFDAYIEDRKRDGKPTIKQVTSWKALKPTFGPLRPAEITKAVCYRYWDLRADGGWSKGTTWTDLSVLRACLNWAVKNEKLEKAPFIWLPTQPAPRDRYLTRDEADRLIEAAELPHLRLFILLALYTGARNTAILELTWDGVHFDRGIIDFNTAASQDNKIKRRTIVPINDTLRKALREAQRGALTDWVIEWAGSPVGCVRRAFEAAAATAGLDDVCIHTLRHTAGAWLLEAGIDLAIVSQYLGHSSSKVTEAVYAKLKAELSSRLRDASRALETLGRGERGTRAGSPNLNQAT